MRNFMRKKFQFKKILFLLFAISVCFGLYINVSAQTTENEFVGYVANVEQVESPSDITMSSYRSGVPTYDATTSRSTVPPPQTKAFYFPIGEDWYVQYVTYTYRYVEFEVGTQTLNILVCTASHSLLEECANYIDDSVESLYSQATYIGAASSLYNCHSYAWYSQNYLTNGYWIDSPAEYYEVEWNLYEEVSIPQPGDIICYFNAADENLHSGIVVERSSGTSNGVCEDSSLVTVQSKWGAWGLYEHRGDQCPYTTEAHNYDDLTQTEKEAYIATSVRYYRRVNHTHTYTPIYDATKQMHGKQCTYSDCGQIIWTFNHVHDRAVYYNDNSHKVYCDCGDYVFRDHEYTYIGADGSYHIIACEDCNFANEVEHDFVLEKTFDNERYHTASCLCGASQRVPHDEYTEISRNNSFHTIQITCCGTRTVTNIHYFDEYSSTAHTGQCHFCGYTANNVAHSIGYYDRGNGIHSGTCIWCDYTHAEPHIYSYIYVNYQYHQEECAKCDEYQVLEEHSWDDGYDENGNWCTFCIDCEYILQIHPLSLDMIAKLPAEIQTAMQSAPQNALQNVQSNGNVSYVIPIDEEYGILYLNGEYYLLYSPAPDAELRPTPDISAEGSIP